MNWISVKDKLPEIGKSNAQDFLCQTGTSEKVLSFITDDNGDGNFYMDYRGFFDNFSPRVTHWMELPEPPKESE